MKINMVLILKVERNKMSNWICGKCEQEKGKYPNGEKLPKHSRHCPKRALEELKTEAHTNMDDNYYNKDVMFYVEKAYNLGCAQKDTEIVKVLEGLKGKELKVDLDKDLLHLVCNFLLLRLVTDR